MEQRELTRIKSLFNRQNSSNSVCFITSSTDTGVVRNLGRFGARYAPKAILNEFQKMIFPNSWSKMQFCTTEVSNSELEKEHFQHAQAIESQNIAALLKSNKRPIIHIGGGHDHVYPIIKALTQKQNNNIAIINIDAHADTRTDEEFHSGTPFRQLASEHPQQIKILQIGLHQFANSPATLSDLACDQEKIFYSKHQHWLKTVEQTLTQFLVNNIEAEIFVSLDVDAIESSIMNAVSAVNPQGIEQNQIEYIMSLLKYQAPHAHLGIYEYNPIYEDLSNKGAKFIAKMLFDWLNR